MECFYFRLIGTIPGPILFGYLIDKTCLLKDGNCLFYENFDMAVALTIVYIVAKIIAVVFFILALYCSNHSPIKDEPVDLDDVTNK